jgi:LEA14-like dessication related protein
MKKAIIISSSVLVLVITLITLYIYSQYKKLINAEWTYKGSKLKTMSLSKVVAEIYFDIVNDSTLNLSVKEQKYDITVNGKFISKVTNESNIKIKSKETTTMPLLVDVSTSDFISVLGSNWQNILSGDKSKIVIGVKGTFFLKWGIISFKAMPFETTFTLKDVMDA